MPTIPCDSWSFSFLGSHLALGTWLRPSGDLLSSEVPWEKLGNFRLALSIVGNEGPSTGFIGIDWS